MQIAVRTRCHDRVATAEQPDLRDAIGIVADRRARRRSDISSFPTISRF